MCNGGNNISSFVFYMKYIHINGAHQKLSPSSKGLTSQTFVHAHYLDITLAHWQFSAQSLPSTENSKIKFTKVVLYVSICRKHVFATVTCDTLYSKFSQMEKTAFRWKIEFVPMQKKGKGPSEFWWDAWLLESVICVWPWLIKPTTTL